MILRVEQQRVARDEIVRRRRFRRAMHEVINGEDPRARQRLVVLGSGDAVVGEERDERGAHALEREVHVGLGQVALRQPHVRAMGKIRGRNMHPLRKPREIHDRCSTARGSS